MPHITVNGTPQTVPPASTVRDLVAATVGRQLGVDGQPEDGGRLGVAVALDAQVVPRSRWHQTPVRDGQSLDIISAVQGG